MPDLRRDVGAPSYRGSRHRDPTPCRSIRSAGEERDSLQATDCEHKEHAMPSPADREKALGKLLNFQRDDFTHLLKTMGSEY